MHRFKVALTLVIAVGLMTAMGLRAQEHPKQEHPKEHPSKEPAAKAITTADLEKAIKARIAENAKAAGGRFQVQDAVLNKAWSLELVRVHTDKLTPLDANTYFACVDFTADDGTAVDVDFYLKNEAGKLVLADTTVHKLNGKARFMYQQKGGFWERVKTGS